MTYPNLIDP
jgi:hypothetical protein